MATHEDVAILDEVCSATKDTLDLYKEHLRNGRYHDASACLEMTQTLTRQAHNIEGYYVPLNINLGKSLIEDTTL